MRYLVIWRDAVHGPRRRRTTPGARRRRAPLARPSTAGATTGHTGGTASTTSSATGPTRQGTCGEAGFAARELRRRPRHAGLQAGGRRVDRPHAGGQRRPRYLAREHRLGLHGRHARLLESRAVQGERRRLVEDRLRLPGQSTRTPTAWASATARSGSNENSRVPFTIVRIPATMGWDDDTLRMWWWVQRRARCGGGCSGAPAGPS